MTWVQPKNQNELISRLSDARDLKTSEREMENLCACAITEIKRLQKETLDLHAAGCAESERADATEAEIPPLRKRMSDAEHELERVKPFWESQLERLRTVLVLVQKNADYQDENYQRVPTSIIEAVDDVLLRRGEVS